MTETWAYQSQQVATLGLWLKAQCNRHSVSGGVVKPQEASLRLRGAILSSQREDLSEKLPEQSPGMQIDWFLN